MKRRTFIQRIGSILAVLGLTEAEWLTLGNRYYQALAQPSQRKLALLIGINQYPKIPALNGCLTDVELQKELLLHRFGFQTSDILTLTDEQASREFIETAFLDHFGKQVRPDDVVVFHFSGYGTRVKLETSQDPVQNALVTANGIEKLENEQIVNYLLEESLLLLLRSLPTNKVTAVLDTSYYTSSTVPTTSLKIRARPEPVEAQLAAAELDFLKSLKTKTLPSNPIVLAATSDPKQLALEALFSGFSAGLFTYALTQYLWEATPATTIQISLSHVENSLYKLGSQQQPTLLTSKKNLPVSLFSENLLLESSISAQGAITAIAEDGKTAHLWLGGLPPKVLENYGVSSRLTLATGEQLILRSRSGLTAKAKISKADNTSPIQVGQLVQEAVRVLPRNINLTVALDTALERIERVDATSAFAAIAHISTVVAGEQPADYIFGKLLQTPSRYGLFSLSGELIPDTTGEVGEAVKLAVQRLAPKLITLLAAKLWQLTENEGSSRLAVNATLEIINGTSPQVIIQRQTAQISSETSTSKSLITHHSPLSTPLVPIGSRMQYRVQNQSDRPVYLILLGLNDHRTAVSFYPWQTPEEPNLPDAKPLLQQIVIPPTETLFLPQTNAASEWVIAGPAFFSDQQLILSTSPFNETLAALNSAKSPTDQRPMTPLVNPLKVAQALLQDLHNTSAVKAETNSTTADSYVLDVNNWASLSLSFQVG